MSDVVEPAGPAGYGSSGPAPDESVDPFSVGTLVATALDSFLSAAALHLGDALPSGRTLADRDATEAFLALVAASALLDQLGPVMNDDVKLPFQAGLANLARRFAAQHPRVALPRLTPPPVTSLQSLIKAAWDTIDNGSTAGSVRPGSGPLGRPDLGLPKGGSNTGFLGSRPGSGPLFGK